MALMVSPSAYNSWTLSNSSTDMTLVACFVPALRWSIRLQDPWVLHRRTRRTWPIYLNAESVGQHDVACGGRLVLCIPDHILSSSRLKPRNLGAYLEVTEGSSRRVDGGYQCLTLDIRLCRFDLSSARRRAEGCVVNTQFPAASVGKRGLQIVCKVVDVLRYPDTANLLNNEARAYTVLPNLQGEVIPTLYGFYEVWGILQLLALEPVGNAIWEDEQINQTLCMGMKAALQRIHDAGFVHGDIACPNFCKTESGDVFLADLERCKPSGNPSELANEMNEVDGL